MLICHLNLSKYFNAPEKQMEILIETLSNNHEQILFYLKKKDNGFKNNPKVSDEMRMMFHKLKMNLYERLLYLIDKKKLEIVELPYFYSFLTQELLKKFSKCDIIHCHDLKSTLLAYKIKQKLKIPYIITHHKHYSPPKKYIKAYKNSSQIIAVSNFVKQEIIKSNINLEEKIKTIYNMVTVNSEKIDYGELNFLRTPFMHTVIIGMVGKLLDDKNFELVIELAKKYIKTNPNIQFLLLGDGKRDAIIREKTKNLFNFKMLSFVINIAEYMKMFDIFLLPSNNESLGSTILDAMELGKSIVASDVGGIPELIQHEINGLLFEKDNLKSLETEMNKLINDNILLEKLKQDKMYWLDKIHYGQDSLFFQIQKEAKLKIDKFNKHNITQQYIISYNKIFGEISPNTD